MTSDQCIDDFVTLQRGNTYKSALLDQPGPYLLGLASIAREGGFRDDKLRTYGGHTSEKLLVYPGDIYVSLKDVTQSGDLLGSVARVPDRISLGRMTQDTVKLVFKENDAPKNYLYWVLRSPQYKAYCRARAMGTTNLSLSREDFLSYPVPKLTPARENLVAVLEAVEEKVTLNHQISQTLEQMAQALFKSWFVDFEPVKAKVAARERWQALQPENESASPVCYAAEFDQSPALGDLETTMNRAAMEAISGKTAAQLNALREEDPERYQELYETAALFPTAMQASELGEIPEGWKPVQLEHYIELNYGKALKKSVRQPGDYPVYGSGGIVGFNNQKLVDGPGIVVGRKGTVGSIYWEDGDFFPIDTTYYVSTKNGCTLNFAFYLLKTVGLESMNTDAAVPGLNRKNAYRLLVPNFSNSSITRFSQYVEAISNKISAANSESKALQKMRDTLLPKLLSGELTIPDAEARMAEAADA